MPTDPVGWVLLGLLMLPGWFAVRGWYAGRGRSSSSLSEWMPLALAASATWSVSLMEAGGRLALRIVEGASQAERVAAWLVVVATLWFLPFLLGWCAGRTTRRRQTRTTVVLKDGRLFRCAQYEVRSGDLVMRNAISDGNRYTKVTINRADVDLVLER